MRVDLEDIRPPIWRRLRVSSSITLEELHHVIQSAFGWQDCHLHWFLAGGERYTVDPVEIELDALDSSAVTLADVASKPKSELVYEYDFGDGWQHRILVEEIVEGGDESGPVCLAGKRACPPEDCGGPWGYGELLAILADPRHAEHAERKEWAGGHLDPELFDLEETNVMLSELARRRRT